MFVCEKCDGAATYVGVIWTNGVSEQAVHVDGAWLAGV